MTVDSTAIIASVRPWGCVALAGADGGVFAYGNATDAGNGTITRRLHPIVAVTH